MEDFPAGDEQTVSNSVKNTHEYVDDRSIEIVNVINADNATGLGTCF